jgi:8-oxoguanine deaminase
LAIFAWGGERGLIVEGSRIVELAASGRQPTTSVDTVFNASAPCCTSRLSQWASSFFSNSHPCHPRAINKALFPWLTALYPVWSRLDPDTFRVSVRLALVELMQSGCTTAADRHYLSPAGLERAIDIECEESTQLGMRMTISRGSMNLSQKGWWTAA